jgi:hypothetical protein
MSLEAEPPCMGSQPETGNQLKIKINIKNNK